MEKSNLDGIIINWLSIHYYNLKNSISKFLLYDDIVKVI